MLHVERGGLHGKVNGKWKEIPAYDTSLDDIRKAEDAYTPEQWHAWEHVVARLARFKRGTTPLAVWVARMSAINRLDAFLITKNLATDG